MTMQTTLQWRLAFPDLSGIPDEILAIVDICDCAAVRNSATRWATFDALMRGSETFRAVVFSACAARISQLFAATEEALTRRIDTEVAGALVRMSDPVDADLARREISVGLGTPPEVVAEQLAVFERRGWLSLARGRIAIRDVAALRNLARASSGQSSHACKGAHP